MSKNGPERKPHANLSNAEKVKRGLPTDTSDEQLSTERVFPVQIRTKLQKMLEGAPQWSKESIELNKQAFRQAQRIVNKVDRSIDRRIQRTENPRQYPKYTPRSIDSILPPEVYNQEILTTATAALDMMDESLADFPHDKLLASLSEVELAEVERNPLILTEHVPQEVQRQVDQWIAEYYQQRSLHSNADKPERKFNLRVPNLLVVTAMLTFIFLAACGTLTIEPASTSVPQNTPAEVDQETQELDDTENGEGDPPEDPTAIATTTAPDSSTPSPEQTETLTPEERAQKFHDELVEAGIIAEGPHSKIVPAGPGYIEHELLLEDSTYGIAGSFIAPGKNNEPYFARLDSAQAVNNKTVRILPPAKGQSVGLDEDGNIVSGSTKVVVDEEGRLVSDWIDLENETLPDDLEATGTPTAILASATPIPEGTTPAAEETVTPEATTTEEAEPTKERTEAPELSPIENLHEQMEIARNNEEERFTIVDPNSFEITVDVVPPEIQQNYEWNWDYRGFYKEEENKQYVFRTAYVRPENPNAPDAPEYELEQQWVEILDSMDLSEYGYGNWTLEGDSAKLAQPWGNRPAMHPRFNQENAANLANGWSFLLDGRDTLDVVEIPDFDRLNQWRLSELGRPTDLDIENEPESFDEISNNSAGITIEIADQYDSSFQLATRDSKNRQYYLIAYKFRVDSGRPILTIYTGRSTTPEQLDATDDTINALVISMLWLITEELNNHQLMVSDSSHINDDQAAISREIIEKIDKFIENFMENYPNNNDNLFISISQ